MVRVSTSVRVPPEPVLPPSLVVIVNVTAPLALLAGTKVGAEPPPRNVLILASVPERVSVPVPDPLTVTPPPVVAVRLPPETPSVTVMVPAAASTSAMERPLNCTLVSSFVLKLAGSVFTGASFTAFTVIVRVSTSVSVPPVPVLPPSLVVIVNVTDPLALLAGTKLGADVPPRKELIFASVPESVSVAVPDPPTVTPPAVAPVSVPELTPSVTVIVPDAASTSAIERPVN